MGEQIAKFGMQSSGRIDRVSLAILMGGKVIDSYDWTLTDQTDLPNVGLSAFTVEIPDGYVSYALPETGPPVAPTEPFAVKPKHTTLYVATDPAAPFASELSASLGRLGKSIAVHLVTPKETKLLNALHPPLYPFFALVTPNGIVKANWMGFDKGRAAEFEKEVISEAR
jgi:hypothetical protein